MSLCDDSNLCFVFVFLGICLSRKAIEEDSDVGADRTHAKTAEEIRVMDSPYRGQSIVTVFSASPSFGEKTTPSQDSNLDLKISSKLRKFTYYELKQATRSFRPDCLLGEGGFGCVYKGWINVNDTPLPKSGRMLTASPKSSRMLTAVKILNHNKRQGHKEWLAEVNYLSQLVHPNLIKLIGYCMEDEQRVLVYEFLPNGSLESHLFNESKPLPWDLRMKIALGSARGLAFLHEGIERPVIYRDFKTSNILLDADFNVRLSDFGHAKDAPDDDDSHVSTRVIGSSAYSAPEYLMTGHLTRKSDVYSFGVILLELITGRRSIDKSRKPGEKNLVEWARTHMADKKGFLNLVDPQLGGQYPVNAAHKVVQVAAHCVDRKPKARPRMSDVVQVLEQLLGVGDSDKSDKFTRAQSMEVASKSIDDAPIVHPPRSSSAQSPKDEANKKP